MRAPRGCASRLLTGVRLHLLIPISRTIPPGRGPWKGASARAPIRMFRGGMPLYDMCTPP